MKYKLIPLFTLFAITGSKLALTSPTVSPIAAASKPNIVLFLVDDFATVDLNFLPDLKLLAASGVKFTQFVTPNPFCSPSRASILRGQYNNNTDQLYNDGFDSFFRLGLEKETMAVWLQRVGYKTGLFGKYINGYMQSRFVANTYYPPGWSEWYGGNQPSGYNYVLNENGKVVNYQEPGSSHINDKLASLAVDFINRHHNEPMFLYIASSSPHVPEIPAHRHEKWFMNAQLLQLPWFNEIDVSDKPSYIRKRLIIPANESTRLERFRNRLRMMLSVQQMINSVTTALVKYGVRDNTYFVFASDNCWQYGEHRIENGKLTPYQSSNIVPAFVWGPGIPAGVTRNHLVANSDLAQTIAEWAGAAVPPFVDGRSLVPVLKPVPVAFNDWRQAIPLSFQQDLFHPWPFLFRSWPPGYFGIITNQEKYVHYVTLEEELYLHNSDPYELASQHANPLNTDKKKELQSWALALGQCHSATCRQLDMKPPPPE